MKNKTVVVDIDGVLADFELAFCERFGYDHRDKERLEERYPRNALAVSEFLDDPYVYEDLKPIELGLQVVDYLRTRGDVWITLVTARNPIMQTITKRWLQRNKVQYNSTSFGSHKVGAISQINPICAIDDLLSVHNGLLGLNVPVLLIDQPWNSSYQTNINRFNDLLAFIRHFEAIIE